MEGTWLKIKYKNIEGYTLNSFLTVTSERNSNTDVVNDPRVNTEPERNANANNQVTDKNPTSQINTQNTYIDQREIQNVVASYFDATRRHEDVTFYFAPFVERFYLINNVSRQKVLEVSEDWWESMPHEKFDILWNTAQYSDLGNGNVYLNVKMNYAKKKNYYDDWNPTRMDLNININSNLKIYSLH